MRNGLEDKEENKFAAKIELEWKLENEMEIQLDNKVPTISHIPRLFKHGWAKQTKISGP